MNRRQTFANAMTAHDSSQIIFLTKTWLTHHVRDNTIFLPAYEIHRSERKPNAKGNSGHGGVILGIRSDLDYELIELTLNGAIAAVIQLDSRLKLIICVAYNPPAESPYPWSTMEVKYLLDTLTTRKLELTADLIIVGDINLSDANWDTSHSNDDYEQSLLGLFVDINLEQLLRKSGSSNSLDVVLMSNRNSIFSTETNLNLHKVYSLDGRSCSDHLPYVIQLDSTIANVNPTNAPVFSFSNVDWEIVESAFREHSFIGYCYSMWMFYALPRMTG